MNKLLLLLLSMLSISAASAQQNPPPQKRPSIEERLKKTNEILQKEIQLSAAQAAAIEMAFKTFFVAEEQLRKDNPPPPPPPPDPKIKAAMDKLVMDRDASVQKILSAGQFEKYREAAKKLQPPREGDKNKQPPPQQ